MRKSLSVAAMLFPVLLFAAENLTVVASMPLKQEEFSTQANPWVWHWEQNIYVPSEKRETLLTVYLRDPKNSHFLDVWSFRAGATYATDLHAIVVSGQKLILQNDSGSGGRTLLPPPGRRGKDILPRYRETKPTGSFGDLTIVGIDRKDDGLTIHFQRRRDTGNADDLVLSPALEIAVSGEAPGAVSGLKDLKFVPIRILGKTP